MAGTTDFVPFATGVGAHVTAQATYIAEATTSTGFVPGVASSFDCNKVWRQATFQAAVVATFAADVLGINVPDDGNLSAAVTNFTNAVIQASSNASNITSGTLAAARLPGTIGSNTTGNAATATNATSAAQASTVVTTLNTSNLNFGVAFCNGYNIDFSNAFLYNPNTDTLQLGNITTTGDVIVKGGLRVGNAAAATSPGDLAVARTSAPTTGVIYLGNSGLTYLYFDGTQYLLSGSFPLTVNSLAASGNVTANYFVQTSANNENPSISQVMVTNGSDNFLRKSSLAALVASMGLTPYFNNTNPGIVKITGTPLYLQWGVQSKAAASDSTVTFVTPFPTACWGVQVVSGGGSSVAPNAYTQRVNNVSASGFTMNPDQTAAGSANPTVNHYWLAIGY